MCSTCIVHVEFISGAKKAIYKELIRDNNNKAWALYFHRLLTLVCFDLIMYWKGIGRGREITFTTRLRLRDTIPIIFCIEA